MEVNYLLRHYPPDNYRVPLNLNSGAGEASVRSLSSGRLALVIAGRTAQFMKNHALVGCVSFIQCLLLNLQGQAPWCIEWLALT
jgi:hypothetical protein